MRSVVLQGVDLSLCCRLAIGIGTCSWGVLCSSLAVAGAGVCVPPRRTPAPVQDTLAVSLWFATGLGHLRRLVTH